MFDLDVERYTMGTVAWCAELCAIEGFQLLVNRSEIVEGT